MQCSSLDGHLRPKHVVLKYKWKKKEQFVELLRDCVIHSRFNMACNRMLKYRITFGSLFSSSGEEQSACNDSAFPPASLGGILDNWTNGNGRIRIVTQCMYFLSCSFSR
jgi:hypothetical protein